MAGPRELQKAKRRQEAEEARLASRRATLETRARVDADNEEAYKTEPHAAARRNVPQSERAAAGKALAGPAENKGADTALATSLDTVAFASPQARQAAADAGLTAEDFKRRRKGSESGYNKDDVARIAASRGEAEE